MKFRFNKKLISQGKIENLAELIAWIFLVLLLFTIGLPIVLIGLLTCFERVD